MARHKFSIGDRVIGNNKKASFWERCGVVVNWLAESSQYGVRFDDRPETTEYVMSTWLDSDSRLEALLLEGLASGEGIPLTDDFWRELKADAAHILCQKEPQPRRTAKKEPG